MFSSLQFLQQIGVLFLIYIFLFLRKHLKLLPIKSYVKVISNLRATEECLCSSHQPVGFLVTSDKCTAYGGRGQESQPPVHAETADEGNIHPLQKMPVRYFCWFCFVSSVCPPIRQWCASKITDFIFRFHTFTTLGHISPESNLLELNEGCCPSPVSCKRHLKSIKKCLN